MTSDLIKVKDTFQSRIPNSGKNSLNFSNSVQEDNIIHLEYGNIIIIINNY